MEYSSNIRMTVYAALFVALISIGAYVVIPIGPVPITLQTFFILVAGVLLGKKTSTATIATYLLAGVIGLPVFSGGGSGIARIVASPAGGYLMASVPAVFVISFIVEDKPPLIIRDFLAMLAGTLIIYAGGLLWLKYLSNYSFKMVLALGFYPFIIPDLVKIIVACPVIIMLRQIMFPNSLPTGFFKTPYIETVYEKYLKKVEDEEKQDDGNKIIYKKKQ